MANFYIKYPQNGIPIYPTFAAFPVTATEGSLAVAQDTGVVYEFFTGSWMVVTNPSAAGTVTSVGLLDSSITPIYMISGTPITTAGTLTFTLANQSANLVFAGPTTGAAAQPTFRSLVVADLPAVPPSSLTLTNAHILVGNGSNVAADVAMSGDVHIANTGATSLVATSNSTLTSLSALTSAAALASLPALTTASALATVGTIGTGVWNGTVITPFFGGASPVTRVLYVAGDRTDTYTATGSFTLPFKTISAAINQIIANADNATHAYTVNVYPGTYSETLNFNNSHLYNIVFNSLSGNANGLQTTAITVVTDINSTSNNTQLATLVFIGFTFNGSINLTGDTNGTNFASSQVLFNYCQFNNSSGTIVLNNINNVNFYSSQIQGSGSVATFTNVAFAYMEGAEGFIGGTTLHLVDNPGANTPSQYSGNYMLFSSSKMYATMTIDAGSEADFLQSYTGSTSSVTSSGTIHSFGTTWGGPVVNNSGATLRTRGDTFISAPTGVGTFLYQNTGYNATQVAHNFSLTGATSGTISILPQAAAGTFNFNLPTTAGTTGQVLTSAGGGSSPMTWASSAVAASTVRLSGGNGAGSSNTNVRRFTSNAITGTDLTYADSATLGMSVTVNTAGVYHVTYTDSDTSNAVFGASLNSTASPTGLAVANTITRFQGAAGLLGSGSGMIKCAVNDVIRAVYDGTATLSASADIICFITRIS